MKRLAAAGLAVLLASGAYGAEAPKFQFPPVAPPKPTTGPDAPDLAFGAFQRGYYLTAFGEATRRVEQSQDPVAMTLLGELYNQGLGVPRDLTKAAAWYAEAARRGNKDAIFAYGMAKINGPDEAIRDPAMRGIPKDETGGILLLNKAAELKVPAASYNLGILALRPSNGPPDYGTAAKRFSEAAESGNADALYSLGVLAKEGKGMTVDAKRAVDFFSAAAKGGNIDAMIELAVAMFNGNGVDKNDEEAATWLEKAAEAGSPIARNRLARLYAAGKGVPPNPIEAGAWHLLAKSAGMKDQDLDKFFDGMTEEMQLQAIERARQLGL